MARKSKTSKRPTAPHTVKKLTAKSMKSVKGGDATSPKLFTQTATGTHLQKVIIP